MSLYKKHRPKKWETIIGNAAVIDSLRSQVAKKNPPHCFLFTGPTGCGKTTISRILAKELNCVGADYREINSASFRGIDTAREVIAQANYKALEGANRMFMIDECHKLTNDAQNALLKLMEDTPPHVYLVFATTEPDKLLKPFVGRCSVYQLNTLTDTEMKKLLTRIVKKEGESLDEEVYEQIILDSLGHPRNALTVLEQVLTVEPNNRLEIAKKKAEEYIASIELCRALLKKAPWRSVAEILRSPTMKEVEGVRRAVCGYAAAVLIKGQSNDTAGLILEEFKNPFYDSGFPGLVYACYTVIRN